MAVSRLKYGLLIFLLMCNFENYLTVLGDTHADEMLTLLSSKLAYISAGIEQTQSLLRQMSAERLRDCRMVQEFGNSLTGVYNVSVTGTDITPVWCDMETDGGGWTVFQRRIDGATDFYRGWAEYRDGFGDVNHEFWLGNDKVHTLTSHCDTELRIDMEDFENNTAYAKYSRFNIGNAADAYRLNVSGYSGNAGDSLIKIHNGHLFTTKDNDQTAISCSLRFKGAWWYNRCHESNLNGLYLSGPTTIYAQGVVWFTWKSHYYSLKDTKMMFRRVTKT